MTAPAPRYDVEGVLSDEQRAAAATNAFVRDFGPVAALYLDSCIHCGMCAEACHFYEVTKDPKYTPVLKVEPLKQAYKREYGPFALFFRLFGLKRRVTAAELEQWQELLYDSCTLCGRCSLICPVGIDIASLIAETRYGMAAAGLVPHELWQAAEAAATGSPSGLDAETFRQRIAALEAEHHVVVPVDKPTAKIFATVSDTDLLHYPASIVAMAKLLNHLGCDWTLSSTAFDATNAGVVAGRADVEQAVSRRLIQAALDCEADIMLLPECGHAYGSLRWRGATAYGEELPFRILHITEFLAEQVTSGRLHFRPLNTSVTFHDPCQVARRGGVIEAPRIVLAALGAELREMFPTKGMNWCCGGGGGVVNIQRADKLRHRVFELKREQIDATEADLALTSCSGCRRTFDDAQAHLHWETSLRSLLELAAEHLPEAPA